MTDDGCYCCCGRIVGHTGNCYGVESPIRNARASDAIGDAVSQVIAELKSEWRKPRVDEDLITKLIDQLPGPPKPDVVKACAAVMLANHKGMIGVNHDAIRAVLRKARELWGLPPLKELEE